MALKVGIIGPTNMRKLVKLTGKSEQFFLKKADSVGKMLAAHRCELWVNSDGGMIREVAVAYKNAGGGRLVMLYPKKGEPWPNKHVKSHTRIANKLNRQQNWFWTNYQVVSIPELVVCVGLSAGTLSELAYIKWNRQFKRGNLKRLIVLQELVRGKRIPPEIEVEIKGILVYLKKTEELKRIISQYLKN